MLVLVCIDDTDIIGSRGTGELATMLSKAVDTNGWGKSGPVTRHQLLIHPDIPYTSHNSSMCFSAELNEDRLSTFIKYASGFLQTESEDGADPGLCVACIDRIAYPELLVAFGQRAKNEVLTKEEASELAAKLDIHLSEHGGTGQGIIGALAGVGLRLSGSDGRLKGKLEIEAANRTATVREIMAQTKVDLVKSIDGVLLNDDEVIKLGDWVKPVLIDKRLVLLVFALDTEVQEGVKWHTCTKQQLKDF